MIEVITAILYAWLVLSVHSGMGIMGTIAIVSWFVPLTMMIRCIVILLLDPFAYICIDLYERIKGNPTEKTEEKEVYKACIILLIAIGSVAYYNMR